MKGRSVDVTCRAKKNVLESYLMLKRIDCIYNLSLYETENIHILIGWIPIPMPNEKIKNNIKNNYRKIITISEK